MKIRNDPLAEGILSAIWQMVRRPFLLAASCLCCSHDQWIFFLDYLNDILECNG